ncbi:MAG: hypothetical protein HZB16_04850 [Armatimonadetes bacterium]|nr:hypothetical protein [Armatimonadota bacterium]
MNDDASLVCANCGAPLPPGVLDCSHCGRSPRRRGVWWVLLQAAAGLLGVMLAGVGGMCSLTALMVPPVGLIFLMITVPVLLIGVALIRWAAGDDAAQAGEMHRKFGPGGGARR